MTKKDEWKIPAEYLKPAPAGNPRKDAQNKIDADKKAEEAELKSLFSKTKGLKDQENMEY